MRKMQPDLLVLFSFFTILGPACKKDDNPEPAKSKTQLISQSPWKFSTAVAGTVDVSSSIDACLKDNILSFATDGTGNVNESAIVCNPSGAGGFIWTFQNNEGILYVSNALFPGGSNQFTIETLNGTYLVLSQMMTIPPAPATKVNVTFVH